MTTFTYPSPEGDVQLSFTRTSETLQVEEVSYLCNETHVLIDGRRLPFWVLEKQGERLVWLNGEVYRFPWVDPRERSRTASDTGLPGGLVKAQMPGKILKLSIQAGDHVNKGQNLLIMESMKMELAVDAATEGLVTAIEVVPGQRVDQGDLLVTIEPAPSS